VSAFVVTQVTHHVVVILTCIACGELGCMQHLWQCCSPQHRDGGSRQTLHRVCGAWVHAASIADLLLTLELQQQYLDGDSRKVLHGVAPPGVWVLVWGVRQ
jgi:hypothetical protein